VLAPVVKIARLLLVAVLLLAAAAPAQAFPGRNGQLTYEGKTAKGLYVRNANGTGTHLLPTPARATRPAFSPAGRRIAFASRGQIWVMQADGTAPRRVTGSYYPGNVDPAWSPDGQQLVYSGGPAGARDLFAVTADGDATRRLTSRIADDGMPAWSSRNRIAFVRRSRAGDGDIWTLPGNGGSAPRRVTGGSADDRDPAWSPDGRRIAFTRAGRDGRDVYVADEGGRKLRRLRALPADASAPVWSPNGRWIAFAMGRKGRRGVYLMRSSGRGLRRYAAGVADARSVDWQARPGDPLLAGAGDIACDPSSPNYGDGYGTSTGCRQRATANQLLRMDLAGVLMLGDSQYEDSTMDKFMASYDPSWGRLKGLTRPVIGNHEYWEPTATAYWDYFNGPGQATGPAGTRGQGWYSFDAGTWHVVVLNSNCSQVGCEAGTPQEQWLRADLAAHPVACTLALMHHPLHSSGSGDEGATPAVRPLWQALYDHGADLIMAGHDHAYERFAPLDPYGVVDPVRGLRSLVVGTGGKSLQATVSLRPGSEVRDGSAFGVAALTLHAGSYDWRFLPERAGGFSDAGSGACH
jgi:Tol biopolymer transport system component